MFTDLDEYFVPPIENCKFKKSLHDILEERTNSCLSVVAGSVDYAKRDEGTTTTSNLRITTHTYRKKHGADRLKTILRPLVVSCFPMFRRLWLDVVFIRSFYGSSLLICYGDFSLIYQRLVFKVPYLLRCSGLILTRKRGCTSIPTW
jgi:hypothetical protein